MEEIRERLMEVEEVNIVPEDLIAGFGGTDFMIQESELLIGKKYANVLYKQAKKDFQYIDLGLIINGEWQTGWNYKAKNLNDLDIQRTAHVNKLSIQLHRKAAIAWHFRSLLIPFLNLEDEHRFLYQLADRQKQNYYLWSHKMKISRYFSEDLLLKDHEECKDYCQSHPSDSSAWHYLAHISNKCNLNTITYEWTLEIAEKYYGVLGLYSEDIPPGYECVHLCLAKLSTEHPVEYIQDQEGLGRPIKKVLYISRP